MDPAQSKSSSDNQNPQKIFCKQPITCPWIATQPYPSTMNKNRTCDSTTSAKPLLSIPLSMESRTINEKTCPSLQHSSSRFFYFLQLMQLFPETHPATLHTLLCLCKNDFFCAVDKLLYAKRCEALNSRSQGMFKRCLVSRNHPYCGYGNVGKPKFRAASNRLANPLSSAGSATHREPRVLLSPLATYDTFAHRRSTHTPATLGVWFKQSGDAHNDLDVAKAQAETNVDIVEENQDIVTRTSSDPENINKTDLPSPTMVAASSVSNNQENRTPRVGLTSPDIPMQAQELKCDKAPEAQLP